MVVSIRHQDIGERFAEIQIRTTVENAWAQMVERIDAVLGSDLKHGDGPAEFMDWLMSVSDWIGTPAGRERTTMPEMPPFPWEPSS